MAGLIILAGIGYLIRKWGQLYFFSQK